MASQKIESTELKSLLDSANSASQAVATVHITFIAVCAYVLIVAFGTTDLDLLVGKGIRLPVINTEVPIVWFYSLASYLVLLTHFNLLLQFQLLSRKLYAFDDAVSRDEQLRGQRDQLNIFPFAQYLVGHPDGIVGELVRILINTTVVFLPFASLCILQLRFLAYQDESITWAQRIAVWFDGGLVLILWPIIVDRRGSLTDYCKEIIHTQLQGRRIWWFGPTMFLGVLMAVFAAPPKLFWAGIGLSLLSLFALVLLWKAIRTRGGIILLVALPLYIFLPLALMVDGERLEQNVSKLPFARNGTYLTKHWLAKVRRLDLKGQEIVSKPVSPGVSPYIRQGNRQAAGGTNAPVLFKGRYLRRANLEEAVLFGANLEEAHLEGATLRGAQLQGARLKAAQMQKADFYRANLQEADLSYANLQEANLYSSHFQGANLTGTHLQGAVMWEINLEGAGLMYAQLQGTVLWEAKLQAADLRYADLRGAAFGKASLHGANLENASLGSSDMRETDMGSAIMSGGEKTCLIDLREMKSSLPTQKEVEKLAELLQSIISDEKRREVVTHWITDPRQPVRFCSCMIQGSSAEAAGIRCAKRFNADDPGDMLDFTEQVHADLAELACEAVHVARGIIRQLPKSTDRKDGSAREGLNSVLARRLNADEPCHGLNELTKQEKDSLSESLP